MRGDGKSPSTFFALGDFFIPGAKQSRLLPHHSGGGLKMSGDKLCPLRSNWQFKVPSHHNGRALRPSLKKEEIVSLLASRGCYNGCSLCLIPALNPGRPVWRGRTASDVVAEVAELMKQGKEDLYFADPNFIGPGKTGRDKALDLSRALAELGITFGMETRANDLSGPLMQNFSKAGLTSLLLGIESGSPPGLEATQQAHHRGSK